MFAKTAESDLLSAITLAGRQLNAEEGGRKELIIIDSGLTTAEPLDFSESLLEGITAEQAQEAKRLSARDTEGAPRSSGDRQRPFF